MGSGASSRRRATRADRFIKIKEKIKQVIDEAAGADGGSHTDRAHEFFSTYDQDASGAINQYDFLKICDKCGANFESGDMRLLFDELDADKDGKIDKDEFASWLYSEDGRPPLDERGNRSYPRLNSLTTVPAPRPKHLQMGSPLLKTTREPLLVFLHSAAQILPSSGAAKECSADVVAFVKVGDKVVGPQGRWPVFKNNNNPCWNTARDLGCHTMGPGADEHSALHLQVLVLKDSLLRQKSHSLLGEVRLSLADIKLNEWYTEKLAMQFEAPQERAPELRFMIMSEPPLIKKVFLVRHAESAWNKAQKDRKVKEMLEQVDHPLSAKGLEQCKTLQQKIAAKKEIADAQARGQVACEARQDSDAPTIPPTPSSKQVANGDGDLSHNEARFLSAQLAVSSPLTRAIETALVGLSPIISDLKNLRLWANARERRNILGRDTTGQAKGKAEIFQRLRRALGPELEEQFDRYLHEIANELDTTEANCRWWNDSRETEAAFRERVWEFLRQLLYLSEESIIVVGHSHFFRSLIQQTLNLSATIVGVDRAALCSKKLMNCGVMAVTLDFRKGADRPMTEVEMLLDSHME
jgi:broad specificity phosphatase PhoE